MTCTGHDLTSLVLALELFDLELEYYKHWLIEVPLLKLLLLMLMTSLAKIAESVFHLPKKNRKRSLELIILIFLSTFDK